MPTVPRSLTPAFVLALVSGAALPACSIDFNSFLDGARNTTDGGGTDDADMPGSDVPATPGTCARPYITIGMTSGLSSDHGRIVRFEVTPNSTRRCDDLRAGGTLDRGGWAATDVPGAGMFYVYNEGVTLIDEARDRVLWDQRFNDINLVSLEAFALRAPDGRTLPAVATVNVHAGSASEPWSVRTYDPSTGALVNDWSRATAATDPWPTSLRTPLRGMTFNPLNPAEALTVVVNSSGNMGSAAMAVNFFTGATRLFAGPQGTASSLMSTIAATGADAHQLAWVGGADLSLQTGVYYLRNPAGDGTGQPTGPQQCPELCTAYIHAVPDPTSDIDRFALCSRSGVQRLVRMGSCTEVTSTTTEGDAWNFRRIGTALAQ